MQMLAIAFLGELVIRFIAVSNHRKRTFESDVSNVLKEIEIFLFDENLPKARDSTTESM